LKNPHMLFCSTNQSGAEGTSVRRQKGIHQPFKEAEIRRSSAGSGVGRWQFNASNHGDGNGKQTRYEVGKGSPVR